MDEFKNTEATGCYAEFPVSKKNIFKIIYNFIPAALIILILGFTVGAWWTNNIHNQKVADSIKLQRFLHKTTVYNITPNIDVSK